MNSPTPLNSTLTPIHTKCQTTTNPSLRSWMKNSQRRFNFNFYTFLKKTPLNKPETRPPTLQEVKVEQKKQEQTPKQSIQMNWGETITPVKEVEIKEEILKTTFATKEKQASQSSEYKPESKLKGSKKNKKVKKQRKDVKKKQQRLERQLF